MSEESIDALRVTGLTDRAIHDAIQVVAFFNYINRVADAVGIGPEPEWDNALDGSRSLGYPTPCGCS